MYRTDNITKSPNKKHIAVKSNNIAAFTLLELSIVLVIIGLIVGGITVGADMIRAAELRAIMTEHQRYTSAVMTFKDRYLALPGDMKNATKFWGTLHSTPSTCKTTAATGKATCDGDGDGTLDSSTGSYEYYRFWQHLANAGMIEGLYAGNQSTAQIGTNVPPSKVINAGWSVYYRAGTYAGSTTFFSGIYGNYMVVGAENSSDEAYGAIMNPEEAWNIDKKVDDGKPGMGGVIAANWDTCTDATANSDTDADYDLSNASIVCSLMFLRQF